MQALGVGIAETTMVKNCSGSQEFIFHPILWRRKYHLSQTFLASNSLDEFALSLVICSGWTNNEPFQSMILEGFCMRRKDHC
ncbi:hypothetical protein CMV_012857 [Castanea mollissima]|uniref:Uncharacterized protein n=1 Tax=Castanea mollissima TaxID=60419 RepID=A0A8J4REJ8_9ROSI|nr:hypothetical protein CMV_012857 [Castanea mollissima]